ncbi:hypothetical protein V2J09_000890 [Rumex salicifolius]
MAFNCGALNQSLDRSASLTSSSFPLLLPLTTPTLLRPISIPMLYRAFSMVTLHCKEALYLGNGSSKINS